MNLLRRNLLERRSLERRSLDVHEATTLVCKPGTAYPIFSYSTPLFYHVSIDLHEAREGDRFLLQVEHCIGDDYYRVASYTLEGEFQDPLFNLPMRFAPGVKITFTQEVGIGKKVVVEVFGREETA